MASLNGGDYFSSGGHETWSDIEKGGSGGGGRHSIDDESLSKGLLIIAILLAIFIPGGGIILALPLLYLAWVVKL